LVATELLVRANFLWDFYNFGRATISKSYEPSGTSLRGKARWPFLDALLILAQAAFPEAKQ
jgi:hypothetical protein